jgi:hypothetical protein
MRNVLKQGEHYNICLCFSDSLLGGDALYPPGVSGRVAQEELLEFGDSLLEECAALGQGNGLLQGLPCAE